MPGVTAILVARDGGDTAERALENQTRRPDSVVMVAAGSSLHRIVGGLPAAPDEWLWMLPADAVPEPDALARLLAAVEVAPSVVIAGPKLVDPEDRGMLRSFGESVTRYGSTMPLADDELDQSQHDSDDDVLGVVLPGMLIRRSMWDLLGGPDPGLPTYDAGLDLSIRARLAGGRVVRVAGARVAVAAGAQDFARRRALSPGAQERARRVAHLHRRLAYAPGGAVAFHWLALLPLALVRSIGLALGKRPGAIPGELAASVAAIFDGSVPAARAAIRRTRRAGWAALAPLRIAPDVVRERRASTRDRAHAASGTPDLVRAGFFPGGLAVTVVAAVLGVVLGIRLLGSNALTGGGLLPLAGDVGSLWPNLGWGDAGGLGRDGLGLVGPADPFSAVLAVLGSLTPWNPSFALVLLWIVAPPLAALAAWWCATRLSSRAWPPVLAAALWALAPPFLAAMIDGRPAAVLVHVLLPWLVLAVLDAPRSWSAAGAAGLLFAAVGASAPVLMPALLAGTVIWALAHPRAIPRLLAIPLPALALFAPLIAAQVARGTPLGLFADPGVQLPYAPPSGWQLLLGSPSSSTDGWQRLVEMLGLPAALGTPASIALLAPLAAIVILALFLPGSRRTLPAAAVALAGLLTAVVAAHLAPATSGADAVAIWPGSGLSLYWAGLLGVVAVSMAALRRAAVAAGIALLLSAAAAVAPSLVTLAGGTGSVAPGDGHTLPAIVAAEAIDDPGLGTLVLTPQADGSLAATVVRGSGARLDTASTFAVTRSEPSAEQRDLAELAGNLASRGGFDPEPVLERLGIEFVVLPPARLTLPDGEAGAIRERAAEALDAQPALEAVGDTERGSLWRFPKHEATAVSAASSTFGVPILVAQGVIIGFTVLLALPTGLRRRRRPEGDDDHETDPDLGDGLDGDGFEADGFDDDFDAPTFDASTLGSEYGSEYGSGYSGGSENQGGADRG
jgi:GT2 family glycosyltransferase